MQQQTNKVKFGEMLCALGLTDQDSLSETMRMARKVGLPLGRALVFNGQLTEPELRIAIELQSLMRDENLSMDVARKAVTTVRADGGSLRDALRKAGWQTRTPQQPVSTLGSLLVESKLIDEKQLEEARRLSYETGMPIGKMLVLAGSLNESQLKTALETQAAVRDQRCAHADGVKRLTALKASGPAKVVQTAMHRPRIRLGDLLMLSGILTENDVLNALELGFSRQQSVGESLVALGAISHSLLTFALELQQKISAGQCKLMDAVAQLQRAGTDAAPDGQKPADPIMLGELLRISGLIDEDDISQAIELTPKFPAMLGKMLVVAGAIDDATLLSALRCQFMLRHHLISLEDAIMALQYSQRNMLSYDDAIDELGVKVATRERRDQL